MRSRRAGHGKGEQQADQRRNARTGAAAQGGAEPGSAGNTATARNDLSAAGRMRPLELQTAHENASFL